MYRTRQKLPWAPEQDFRILSIDGGGIRGILPLSILARLEQSYLGGSSICNCFDLLTGTSTGGIIALGLSIGKTATELLKIYMEKGGEVFPSYPWYKKKALDLWQFAFNRCDQAKLNSLIDEILAGRKLWESSTRLCIPAAETRHFEPYIFKTPHHPDYRIDWRVSMAHVAKTTSAAPTFYKPVPSDDGYEFVDGGIWSNNPIMVGVADALACFDVHRSRVKVLSLGCVEDQFSMSWARRHLGGMFFWRTIMYESMHIQSKNVTGQARLIVGGDRVTRVDGPPISPRIELWDWARCRTELPAIGEGLFTKFGPDISKSFLTSPAQTYAPFYRPSSQPN